MDLRRSRSRRLALPARCLPCRALINCRSTSRLEGPHREGRVASATDGDIYGELTVMDSAAKPIAQLPMYGRGARQGQLVASPGAVDSQTLNLSWTGKYPVTTNSITTGGSGFNTSALSLPLTFTRDSRLR